MRRMPHTHAHEARMYFNIVISIAVFETISRLVPVNLLIAVLQNTLFAFDNNIQ